MLCQDVTEAARHRRQDAVPASHQCEVRIAQWRILQRLGQQSSVA